MIDEKEAKSQAEVSELHVACLVLGTTVSVAFATRPFMGFCMMKI